MSAHIASAASTVTAPVSSARGERRVDVAGTTHSGAMEAAALPDHQNATCSARCTSPVSAVTIESPVTTA